MHEARYAEFRDAFVEQSRKIKQGDPLSDDTDFGPMIHAGAAARICTWVQEAIEQGATVALGGECHHSTFPPTILENTAPDMRVVKDEVFGPVVNVIAYSDIDNVIERINDSDFGLQTGIYTNDMALAMSVIHRLNVGGVMINDVPTFRVDHMPYGGNKLSGVGREGPRFAIEEMTTLKMVVINT
jgi:acyl-CoA reductase-like NAD-dependent aldehyde dehydrogenase